MRFAFDRAMNGGMCKYCTYLFALQPALYIGVQSSKYQFPFPDSDFNAESQRGRVAEVLWSWLAARARFGAAIKQSNNSLSHADHVDAL